MTHTVRFSGSGIIRVYSDTIEGVFEELVKRVKLDDIQIIWALNWKYEGGMYSVTVSCDSNQGGA